MKHTHPQRHTGLPQALSTYFIWGLLPLYMKLVHDVPPFEFVGWRIVFTLPVCLAIVLWRRQLAELMAAMRNRRTLGLLAASSLFIGVNWVVYVMAVLNGHVLATSLGYYINPLVNVLAGTLLLKERLSRAQWAAVALAAAGVSLLAWGARDTLAISLTLAFSFASYGLVRKLAPVGSLPGLTIEAVLLLLPALGVIAWYAASPAGSSLGKETGQDLLLAISGVVTAVPLLLFAVAARRMAYSALGFVQFLAPSIIFVLGIFVFHEPLKPVQLACFMLIWAAIAVFVWDLLARRKN